jgi:hypothetical protein
MQEGDDEVGGISMRGVRRSMGHRKELLTKT